MRFPLLSQHLLIEWSNGLARVPIGGRPVVRTGVQVSVFSGRLHRIPRTYPRFWAGLRALKLPIYPFFGPAYRPGPPRFIRTAGRPLCVYSGVLLASLSRTWLTGSEQWDPPNRASALCGADSSAGERFWGITRASRRESRSSLPLPVHDLRLAIRPDVSRRPSLAGLLQARRDRESEGFALVVVWRELYWRSIPG